MYYPVGTFDPEGYFLAFTDLDGVARAVRSIDDGASWQSVSLANTGIAWFDAAYNLLDRSWTMIGASVSAGLRSTDEGRTFSNITLPTANNIYGAIDFNGDYLCAVAGSVAASPAISTTSLTGKTGEWTGPHTQGNFFSSGRLCWSDDLAKWLCVQNSLSTIKGQTSSDGKVWATQAGVPNAAWHDSVWSGPGGNYVLVGSNSFPSGTPYYALSPDGVNYGTVQTGTGGDGIVLARGRLIAVHGQTAYLSDDHGNNWNAVDMSPGPPGGGQYISVAYNGRVVCAVSYNDGVTPGKGFSCVSYDLGETWIERQNMPDTDNWTGVRASVSR